MEVQALRKTFRGEIETNNKTLSAYSRDASLFDIKPAAVVFPTDANDIKTLVRWATEEKKRGAAVSLTARSAGTDMSGGALTESVVVDVMRHMNAMREIGDRVSLEGVASGYAVTEPGVLYRDFEKATLAKGYLLPSYPASRGLCAMGGVVSNDSGGEKSLQYGKTHSYVTGLKMVLSDGEEQIIRTISVAELNEKIKEPTSEGRWYKEIHSLLEEHYEHIQKMKPTVSKNSAGYNIWDTWDKKTFDLTKLFVGSQGTLGIVTEASLRLVPVHADAASGMLIVFLRDLSKLANIITAALPSNPSSFESFDDHTFRLAMKFWWGFVKILAKNPFSLALAFLPEFLMVLTKGMPRLVLIIEFEERTQGEVDRAIAEVRSKIARFGVEMKIARTKEEAKKYWAIRRESFNLLRQKVKGMQTAPFIDDVIVRPEHLPEFLPKLYAIGEKYKLLYTIAGHVGDGNFHVIPLMKLGKEGERAKIKPAMDEVYDLVLSFGGSITAEHNDGLIRSPYLEKMFGSEIVQIFEKIKDILDPHDIFNPGKKVRASLNYALDHIKRS